MLLALNDHVVVRPCGASWKVLCLLCLALPCCSESAVAPAATVDAGTDADADAASPDAADAGDGLDDAAETPDADSGEHPCMSAPDLAEATTISGSIDPVKGEAHHYRYQMSAGEMVAVGIGMTTMLTQYISNPAISLWTEDGSTLLASDDEGSAVFLPNGYPVAGHDWMRFAGRNSNLVYRSAEEATVCIRIEESATWTGSDVAGQPILQYTLWVGQPQDTCSDAEPNDTVQQSQPTEECTPDNYFNATRAVRVAGMLDGEDTDVFRIQVPEDTGLVDFRFNSPGPGGPMIDGSGSSLELGRVELLDASGAVYARADATLGVHELYAHVPVGQDVFLRVPRRPGTTPGANDFYFLEGGVTWPDLLERFGEEETVAGANDTPDTAESQVARQDFNFGFLESIAVGFMNEAEPGHASDVDYWAFGGFENGPMTLRCWSMRIGSGVQNPTFAVLDEEGTVLRSGVESPDHDFAWREGARASEPPLVLPSNGMYYLRVSAEGQDPDVSSRAYVCCIDVFPQ